MGWWKYDIMGHIFDGISHSRLSRLAKLLQFIPQSKLLSMIFLADEHLCRISIMSVCFRTNNVSLFLIFLSPLLPCFPWRLMAVEDELRVGVMPEQKPRMFADQVCGLFLDLSWTDLSVVCVSVYLCLCRNVFACLLCLSERFTGLISIADVWWFVGQNSDHRFDPLEEE